MWQFVLSYAGVREVWLAAGSHNVAMYNRKGLHVDQAHFIKRVSRVRLCSLPDPNPDIALSPINETNLTAMADYDTKVTGIKRSEFLIRWCERGASAAFVASKSGTIVGYGVALLCKGQLYNLSPVYADDFEIARQILAKIVRSLPPESEFFFSANNVEGFSSKMFKGILAPDIIENGKDMFVLKASKRDLAIDMSKIYLYAYDGMYPV